MMKQEDYSETGVEGSNDGYPAVDQQNGDPAAVAAAPPSRSSVQLPSEIEQHAQRLEAEIKALGEDYSAVTAAAQRELAAIRNGELSPGGFFIIHKDSPVRFVRKVYIPHNEHPTMNFVGRLLGVKGATLKALQQQTRARIFIFGRGSMRDTAKEEEMRNSGDPRYSHLKEDLHVYVEIYAPAVEAEQRFANVLYELKRFLDPNNPHPMPGAMGARPPMGSPGGPQRGPYPRGGMMRPRGPPPPQRYAPPPPPQSQHHYPEQAGPAPGYPPHQPAHAYYQPPPPQAAAQPPPPAQYAAPPASYSAPPQAYPPQQAYPGSWADNAPAANGQPDPNAYAAPQHWSQPPAKAPRLAAPYAHSQQPSGYG